MAEIIEISSSDIDFKKGVCAICKKNPVVRWCDFTTKYRHNTIFFRRYQDFKDANTYGAQNAQCDLPMCEDCAAEQDGDMHLCPHHQSLMEQADQPDEYLRMRQKRESFEIADNIMRGPFEGEDMHDKGFYFKVQNVAEENARLLKEKTQLLKEIKNLKKEVSDYEYGQMKLF